MKNRVISIALFIVLIFSSSVIPVSAANIDTSRNMADLFVTSGFDIYLDQILVQSNSLETNISGTGVYYGLRWECANNLNVGYIVVTLRSSILPSRVVLTLDNDNSRVFYSDVPSSSNGYVYQYKIPVDGSTFSLVDVSVNFSSRKYHDVTITSCVGFSDYSKYVNSVYYDFTGDYISVFDATFVHDVLSSNSLGTFPFDVSLEHPKSLNGYDFCGAQTDIKFTSDSLGYTYADKLSLLMFSSGSNHSFSALLKDSITGLVTAVLDCTYVSSPSGYLSKDEYNSDVPMIWYYVEIDLSGYDLSKNTLVFSSWCNEWNISSSVNPVYAAYMGFIGAAVTPHFEEIPWYTILFNWFDKQFNSIGYWFQHQYNAISTWGQNIVNSIASWGQSIINAINPDAGSSEEIENSASDKSDQVLDLTGQMDSMAKPDLNGTGDISGIISPGNLTSYTTFLSTVINAPYISQVIMLSLILSLAAYVLFGKR